VWSTHQNKPHFHPKFSVAQQEAPSAWLQTRSNDYQSRHDM